MTNKKKLKQTNATKLSNIRDLVRLITVLLFVPWFGWITSGIFGLEVEFEAEMAVFAAFLVFGTFWCGWLCPFGNVGYFVSKIGKAMFPNLQVNIPEPVDKALRHAKYFFLAAFIFVIFTENIDYFFGDHMVMYKSTWFTSMYIGLKKYFILLVPLLWPRFFCKYLCFQKGAYNIINRLVPTTTIRRDQEKCISCGKCDRSCPMNIRISEKKKVSGSDCIGCYNCVDSGTCPGKADAMGLHFFGKRVNPVMFGVAAMIIYYSLTYVLVILG